MTRRLSALTLLASRNWRRTSCPSPPLGAEETCRGKPDHLVRPGLSLHATGDDPARRQLHAQGFKRLGTRRVRSAVCRADGFWEGNPDKLQMLCYHIPLYRACPGRTKGGGLHVGG